MHHARKHESLRGGGKGGGRGLCKKCHDAAYYLVESGKTSWKELEDLGLAVPVYKTHFEQQLASRRREQQKKNAPGKPLHEM